MCDFQELCLHLMDDFLSQYGQLMKTKGLVLWVLVFLLSRVIITAVPPIVMLLFLSKIDTHTTNPNNDQP
ncbi:hypothetical protein AC480_06055 [miscellaneous Crenarchaeota group archaeon SMTZ1-55]|nr:MAG: hypothetical protein AC480_06055 [miscellaneous Crenarchaeota group archaeon SMTZ1-55]